MRVFTLGGKNYHKPVHDVIRRLTHKNPHKFVAEMPSDIADNQYITDVMNYTNHRLKNAVGMFVSDCVVAFLFFGFGVWVGFSSSLIMGAAIALFAVLYGYNGVMAATERTRSAVLEYHFHTDLFVSNFKDTYEAITYTALSNGDESVDNTILKAKSSKELGNYAQESSHHVDATWFLALKSLEKAIESGSNETK